MTIQEALQWGITQLRTQLNAFLDSEVLLASILQTDRSFLKINPQKNITEAEFDLYKKFIQERKENRPVAYIIGKKKWADFELFVNENVLIPRDETEVLCNKIIQEWKAKSPQRVLDIGTGSGCIALFLRKIFSEADILALDDSKRALKVAQKNAEKQGMNIRFQHSDLLSAIKEGLFFDIIVANLPYVPEKLEVSGDVRKEPPQAIFSGIDGLDHIRRLNQQIEEKEIGFQELWLEFLPQQKEKIEQIFRLKKVEFKKDIGGDIFFACIKK